MRRLIFGCGYLGRRVAAAWNKSGDAVFALGKPAIPLNLYDKAVAA